MNEEKTEFEIVRTFDAPREKVWRAWTEPEHLAKWWGPKGCALRVESLDLRPGGTFHYAMQMQDGTMMWGKFVYQEIVAPQRLVHIDSFADEHGNIIRAPFSALFPLEILNVLTLEEEDGKTTLTLRGGPHNASAEEVAFFEEMHPSMQQGFGGTLDQLEQFLAQA